MSTEMVGDKAKREMNIAALKPSYGSFGIMTDN
jgi:hypothetical protein